MGKWIHCINSVEIDLREQTSEKLVKKENENEKFIKLIIIH